MKALFTVKIPTADDLTKAREAVQRGMANRRLDRAVAKAKRQRERAAFEALVREMAERQD